MCVEEFRAVLQNSREEDVQQYITNHSKILLKTFCTTGTYICIPKFRFGTEYVSDFIIVQLWSLVTSIILIELEPPTSHIYTRDGRFASRLNGAIQQVNNWFAWIRANNQYFCDSIVNHVRTLNRQTAASLSNRIRYNSVRAKIIVGRRDMLSDSDKARLGAYNLGDRDTEILAYDRLLDTAIRILDA